jgi:hypothetical protein
VLDLSFMLDVEIIESHMILDVINRLAIFEQLCISAKTGNSSQNY